MATAPELEHAITSAGAWAPRVTVNLSEVTFLDSSALNSLIRSGRRLTEQNIRVRLVIPPDHRDVRKVFEITQLTESLGVVDTLDQALDPESPERDAAA